MESFQSYKDEGLRIVDKRGLPYESREQRFEAWYNDQWIEKLYAEAAWALETTYSLPTQEEIEEYVHEYLTQLYLPYI